MRLFEHGNMSLGVDIDVDIVRERPMHTLLRSLSFIEEFILKTYLPRQ